MVLWVTVSFVSGSSAAVLGPRSCCGPDYNVTFPEGEKTTAMPLMEAGSVLWLLLLSGQKEAEII